MTPRANWKGVLQLGAVSCPVALYAASSTSDRIVFNTINRLSGHRVRREFVDADTFETVEKDDQVKGYETDKDRYVLFEPEEIAEAQAKGDKTLAVSAFVDTAEVEEVFLDKPYYLKPADAGGVEVFALVRDALRRRQAAAVAEAVLFRRQRTLLIRADGAGMSATTLKFDYEVRSPSEIFAAIPDLQITDEMLDLAKHIIQTKQGDFDPAVYADRYEAALADLVKAKLEGRVLVAPKPRQQARSIDLMQALRDSAGLGPEGLGEEVLGAKRPRRAKKAAKQTPQRMPTSRSTSHKKAS